MRMRMMMMMMMRLWANVGAIEKMGCTFIRCVVDGLLSDCWCNKGSCAGVLHSGVSGSMYRFNKPKKFAVPTKNNPWCLASLSNFNDIHCVCL